MTEMSVRQWQERFRAGDFFFFRDSLRRINIFKIRRSFSYPSPDFQLTLSQFHAILNYSKATKQKRSGCSRIAFNTNYPP